MTPRASVVLVLHDSDAISEVLASLARQTVPAASFEVLVADASHHPVSGPASVRAVQEHRRTLDVRLLRLPRSGRGAAYNRAVETARGGVILLLADDFVASPRLVESHLQVHDARPERHVVTVGPCRFPPSLRTDPFRAWLEDSGSLLGVSFTRPSPDALSGFFYGGNAGLKASFFRDAGGFDEAFVHHAWDDHELGRRLFAAGMEVVFVPDAAAEHLHPLTIRERRATMREAGESARLFERLHAGPHEWWARARRPAWRWSLAVAKRRARRFLGRDPTGDAYYRASLDAAFARGYRAALRRER